MAGKLEFEQWNLKASYDGVLAAKKGVGVQTSRYV